MQKGEIICLQLFWSKFKKYKKKLETCQTHHWFPSYFSSVQTFFHLFLLVFSVLWFAALWGDVLRLERKDGEGAETDEGAATAALRKEGNTAVI